MPAPESACSVSCSPSIPQSSAWLFSDADHRDAGPREKLRALRLGTEPILLAGGEGLFGERRLEVADYYVGMPEERSNGAKGIILASRRDLALDVAREENIAHGLIRSLKTPKFLPAGHIPEGRAKPRYSIRRTGLREMPPQTPPPIAGNRPAEAKEHSDRACARRVTALHIAQVEEETDSNCSPERFAAYRSWRCGSAISSAPSRSTSKTWASQSKAGTPSGTHS